MVKQAALQLGFHTGLLRLVQLARRQQAVILTFHRFRDAGGGDPDVLPIQRFTEYMHYLVSRYRLVSLRDLAHELRRGVLRPNTAVITIDDGYDDTFTLAVPVLRRLGIPASLFVVSDFIDRRVWPWTDHFRFAFNHAHPRPVLFRYRGRDHALHLEDDESRRRSEERWREHAKGISRAEREELLGSLAAALGVEVPTTPPPEYQPMTWPQLRSLAAEGFDVGAHTRTHPILSQIAPRELRNEIGGCKEHMEANLGAPVSHFAYPNGRRQDYTPEVIAAVSKAGYRAAVTTIPGANAADTPIFELRRVAASTDDLAHFAQAVAGVDMLRQRVAL